MPSTQALAAVGFIVVGGLSVGGLLTKTINWYVGTLVVALIFGALVFLPR